MLVEGFWTLNQLAIFVDIGFWHCSSIFAFWNLTSYGLALNLLPSLAVLAMSLYKPVDRVGCMDVTVIEKANKRNTPWQWQWQWSQVAKGQAKVLKFGTPWSDPWSSDKSRSRSRSRSRNIYFSNTSWRNMNNQSQPSFTQVIITLQRPLTKFNGSFILKKLHSYVPLLRQRSVAVWLMKLPPHSSKYTMIVCMQDCDLRNSEELAHRMVGLAYIVLARMDTLRPWSTSIVSVTKIFLQGLTK